MGAAGHTGLSTRVTSDTGQISMTMSGLRLQVGQERVWLGSQRSGCGLIPALECIYAVTRSQSSSLDLC